MLKLLVIVAVFFTITHAFVPTSRRASNNNGSVTYSTQDKAAASQAQTSRVPPAIQKPPIPKPPATSHPQPENRKEATPDAQESVTIIESASVPSRRDWLDYIGLCVGILVAAITGFGVLAAWCGLPEFKKQAEAALIQANHMRDSDRAWLTIAPTKNMTLDKPKSLPPSFYWTVRNEGNTPARLIETRAVCQFEQKDKLPDTPVYTIPGVPLNERILAPKDAMEFSVFWCGEDGSVFPAERDIKALDTIWLTAYGYVRYKSVFSEKIYEAGFCDEFIWSAAVAGPLAQIVFKTNLTAPISYTKPT